MIYISLTDFVDFVVSSGSPKLTKIRELKTRGEYNPAFDFWKPLREHIIEYHRVGEGDKRYLDGLLKTIGDQKKQTAYPPLITNYKRFLGKKSIVQAPPPRAEWQYKTLTVRVNPELLLSINGQDTIIKLYFKGESISKSKIEIILLLLSIALGNNATTSQYALLDVHHNKFYPAGAPSMNLLPLLYGEADSLLTIWGMLD